MRLQNDFIPPRRVVSMKVTLPSVIRMLHSEDSGPSREKGTS